MQKTRDYRDKKLQPLATFLASKNVTANHVTFLAVITGILAIYNLFNNYYLFFILVIVHIFLDALDGVVARVSTPSKNGEIYDFISDRIVGLGGLAKASWFLQDTYAYIVTGLYVIALLFHLISKMKAPILLIRTVAAIVFIIATHPQFPYQLLLLTVGYLVAGIASAFSLARQLQWFLQKKLH